MTVSALRVQLCNGAAERPRGDYVLYWMIGARRTRYNPALEHAVALCRRFERPLLVVEPLRAGYPWASDRLHAFVLRGMRDNAAALARHRVTYLPYVEREPGGGRGLLRALAARACSVVTDEQPGFFLPRMLAAAAAQLDVRLSSVDGCGVLPLRASERAYPSAALFRRHLQKALAPHLHAFPVADPLCHLPLGPAAEPPAAALRRYPMASAGLLDGAAAALAALPIDHAVAPVETPGGSVAAAAALEEFLQRRLARYADGRNQLDQDVASGLSPYLHFGHLAAHDAVAAVLRRSAWDVGRALDAKPTGRREGWWGLPRESEAFLDELITWRELGHGFAFHRADYDRYESLPDWARRSLDEHAGDPRAPCYRLAELEAAATHDPLWNAAQRELLRHGRIHNYLRMLWGKKILEWTASPREALRVMIELNNKYALDGRDPNSYSGIFWTLGRFDRPWAPTRPIFGCIRYMSSANTARKMSVKGYLARHGEAPVSGSARAAAS
ncbi:MAG: deoxyribodipyrimidine photolyase [Kofleriaceae bacterium]